ncbi:MAG: hypothetical protein EA389_15535 [Ilumatobacter sp.]|nr:MAG: hypothetical protein EA389_15535 [Ilumatobacter sp.]
MTIDEMSRSHRLGWWLFVVSAVLFAVSGVRAGDWLVVTASVVFGAACVVFLTASSRSSR